MKITKLEPIILHAPVTRGGIADSTHTLSHWGAPGVGIHTDTGLVGYGSQARMLTCPPTG